tara:strand:- start:58 stop:264 length:207 start_codon:yes stop_codon:yes gene_type:complete
MELKTILISLGFMFILVISGSAIANFFDIGYLYYVPFLLWIISLNIFYLILSPSYENIYLKNISTEAK